MWFQFGFEGLQGIWRRHFGWKTVPCSCRGDGKRSVADSGQSCRRDVQCRRRRWPQTLSTGNPGDRLNGVGNGESQLTETNSETNRGRPSPPTPPPLNPPLALSCSTERNLPHHVPRHQLSTHGCRTFATAGRSTWNSLPDAVCSPNSPKLLSSAC